MLTTTVLHNNAEKVNRQLLAISGVGITLLYGMTLFLWWQGYLTIPVGNVLQATLLSYLLYGLTCLLYLVPRMRRSFPYLFPIEMYLTVAIGFAAYGAPVAAFAAWLFPIIYAGMYAHRGSMLLTSLLVLVTSPLEAYWVHREQWETLFQDVLIANIVLFILTLRMLSLVNRSRALLAQTEEEVAKNEELERANHLLIREVRDTAEEIGRVVRTLFEMARTTRDALSQISKGADEISAASHESQQLLIQNEQRVMDQAICSTQIGQAIGQAFHYGEAARMQAMAGGEIVSRMGVVMQSINDKSRSSTELVERLAKRMNEIEDLNSAIDNIAKHVTIVAINASIEAARAGAAGRTFQIVAGQVQGLAQQTTEAVKAIGELAINIQRDLDSVTDNMSDSARVVHTGVAVAEEASEKLNGIRQAADQIHELLGQIAVHAKKQQSESEWIAEGITQLSQKTEGNVSHIELAAASTEETAAMMEEYVRHAEQLSERAETLQLLLDRLQTK